MGTLKLYWQKDRLVISKLLSLRGCQGSVRQITSLVLIRWFLMGWFKVSLLGEPKL